MSYEKRMENPAKRYSVSNGIVIFVKRKSILY